MFLIISEIYLFLFRTHVNIYNEKETKKAKTSFVISIIKDYVTPEEWYKKAANSINLTPSKCSGANVKSWADDIIFAIR